jgi:hypothetical protein
VLVTAHGKPCGADQQVPKTDHDVPDPGISRDGKADLHNAYQQERYPQCVPVPDVLPMPPPLPLLPRDSHGTRVPGSDPSKRARRWLLRERLPLAPRMTSLD